MAVVISYIPTDHANSVTRYYVCDLYSELPLTNHTADMAYAKDTSKFYYATAPGVWVESGSGGSADLSIAFKRSWFRI